MSEVSLGVNSQSPGLTPYLGLKTSFLNRPSTLGHLRQPPHSQGQEDTTPPDFGTNVNKDRLCSTKLLDHQETVSRSCTNFKNHTLSRSLPLFGSLSELSLIRPLALSIASIPFFSPFSLSLALFYPANLFSSFSFPSPLCYFESERVFFCKYWSAFKPVRLVSFFFLWPEANASAQMNRRLHDPHLLGSSWLIASELTSYGI